MDTPDFIPPYTYRYSDEALDRMIHLAVRVQSVIPDAVLVGSLATCFYCRHRVPKMNVHMVRDTAIRAELLAMALETIGGQSKEGNKAPWRILRFIFGIETVLVDDFGMLGDDGKHSKLRRFTRSLWPDNAVRRLHEGSPPLEIECFDFTGDPNGKLQMASLNTCFRNSLVDVALRGTLQDYVDCAALYDKLIDDGKEPVDVFFSIPTWYPGEKALLKQILVDIRDPHPHGCKPGVPLEQIMHCYTGFRSPYGDASFIRTKLASLYEGVLHRLSLLHE